MLAILLKLKEFSRSKAVMYVIKSVNIWKTVTDRDDVIRDH